METVYLDGVYIFLACDRMAGNSRDPSGYGPSISSFRLCGSILAQKRRSLPLSRPTSDIHAMELRKQSLSRDYAASIGEIIIPYVLDMEILHCGSVLVSLKFVSPQHWIYPSTALRHFRAHTTRSRNCRAIAAAPYKSLSIPIIQTIR